MKQRVAVKQNICSCFTLCGLNNVELPAAQMESFMGFIYFTAHFFSPAAPALTVAPVWTALTPSHVYAPPASLGATASTTSTSATPNRV